jgi:hypothetical protein
MSSNLTGIIFLGTFGIVTFILALFAAYGLERERKKDAKKLRKIKRRSTLRLCREHKMCCRPKRGFKRGRYAK